LKTSGVRNSRIESINDFVRRRWRARFLAFAICRSSMTGFGVATTHHCRNGIFLHGQSTPIFPKHNSNVTLDNKTGCNTAIPNVDSALSATGSASAVALPHVRGEHWWSQWHSIPKSCVDKALRRESAERSRNLTA
jgi:hypothetical protein